VAERYADGRASVCTPVETHVGRLLRVPSCPDYTVSRMMRDMRLGFVGLWLSRTKTVHKVL